MVIDLQKNKERFEELVKKYIKRDGVEKLLNWLEKKSDFYSAPASTKYHLAVEGGLVQHSLNVFDQLVKLCNCHYAKSECLSPMIDATTIYGKEGDYLAFTIEQIAVVALFHDICKANCYVKDFKNVKVNGKWEQQEYWKWDEKFVYPGHGAKSVYIVQQFMRLSIPEAQAIATHMGAAGNPLDELKCKYFASVFEELPLAVLLNVADTISTFLLERRS